VNPQDIARICHEANRAYCISLGDTSQPPWDNAPNWQKSSAINGVLFHCNHPNASPEESHKNWLNEKIEQGWKYGLAKNSDKKEHPCCVPYAELPADQKLKDLLFLVIVKIFTKSKLESSISNRQHLLQKLNSYDFRDPEGHPLANCLDYLKLSELLIGQALEVPHAN
jgi:hypothetical protein